MIEFFLTVSNDTKCLVLVITDRIIAQELIAKLHGLFIRIQLIKRPAARNHRLFIQLTLFLSEGVKIDECQIVITSKEVHIPKLQPRFILNFIADVFTSTATFDQRQITLFSLIKLKLPQCTVGGTE